MNPPIATYRVQLSHNFTFSDLQSILPYLSQLGISHIYASPVFQARSGSAHGYDILDPNKLNSEFGGKNSFDDLNKAMHACGLEWLQDIVPNHLAYSPESPMVYDLMQKGQGSRYSSVFDVDWNYPAEWLSGKILAPFLAEPYDESLKKRQISLSPDKSKVIYNGMAFPANRAAETAATFEQALASQFYALAHWKMALIHNNYRRFFDISDLIGVLIEDPSIFEQLHSLIFELTSSGAFSGLRVDHIDGLYSPEQYLQALRQKLPDCYLIVEKILTGKEQLPTLWPVQGTTGYDFLNAANKLFIDPEGEETINLLYNQFTGSSKSFGEALYFCKKQIIQASFQGDVKSIARLFSRTLQRVGYKGKSDYVGLRKTVAELMACFPVYRAYNSPKHGDPEPFKLALSEAAEHNPDLVEDLAAIAFLLEQSQSNPTALHAIMRLQQFTGAVMAKGLEDTAFYRSCRLLPLNEVGGDPTKFSVSNEEFHVFTLQRQRHWPHTLNASSTHDTKRGEDARARLNVLSEIPAEFQSNVEAWAGQNLAFKQEVNGKLAPDGNEEFYLYQALLGSFPWSSEEQAEFIERFKLHVIKALREAKVNSSWLEPNVAYEQAVLDFAVDILESKGFLSQFLAFQQKVAYYGVFNSLSQTLLKLTCPGVPDIYQGSELWNLSMVDPDNRRRIDYEKRKHAITKVAALEEAEASNMLAYPQDAQAKLYTIYKTLALRRQFKELFAEGAYLPLTTKGACGVNVVTFCRRKGTAWAVAVMPRFLTSLLSQNESWSRINWGDTTIPLPNSAPLTYRNVLTGKTLHSKFAGLPVGEVFADFPVAVLMGGNASG
jgi:(1->4)-alpha-D-glucan 1-alpha-D-glucosylmutase